MTVGAVPLLEWVYKPWFIGFSFFFRPYGLTVQSSALECPIGSGSHPVSLRFEKCKVPDAITAIAMRRKSGAYPKHVKGVLWA
jgi:hypothetical protein